MAICASDLAFADFFCDHAPDSSDSDQLGNLTDLVAEMVKIKDQRIRLSAVDARVRRKVLGHPVSERLPSSRAVSAYARSAW
jgi:hypothetical protein